MKKEYVISIDGCDDSTEVKMELDDAGFAVICEFSKKSHQESSCICMPTITIVGHETEYGDSQTEGWL
jgi:hypothetical protein